MSSGGERFKPVMDVEGKLGDRKCRDITCFMIF